MNVKLWLTGAVSAAAVVTTGFAAPAATAAAHPTAHAPVAVPFRTGKLPRVPGGTLTGFWAGYTALADKNVKLRYAATNFNVASLNCTNVPAGGVVQATGMDGITSDSEIAGIVESCNGDGTYSVEGFYQLGNTGGVSTGTISPGDAIQASVYYDATTKKYTFTVTDVTADEPIVDATAACPSGFRCLDSSAEAITSLAAGSNGAVPLADYGMENFTGGAVTSANGTKGTFSKSKLWSSDEFLLNDGDGDTAATSSLAGGSAFATTWRTAS